MSSSQSNAQELWKKCINQSMFLRNHCHSKPSLFFTESNSVVLDARSMDPEDREVIHAVVVVCDLLAEDCGFDMVCPREFHDMYVWKKGGAA